MEPAGAGVPPPFSSLFLSQAAKAAAAAVATQSAAHFKKFVLICFCFLGLIKVRTLF
jgi:hypothetical protein